MMYCLAHNESGDWFVIPADKAQDWENWLYSENCDDVPEYATYIGGYPNLIKFDRWERL